MDNMSFMKYHLYERSMNFWLPFWVGYFMILIILYYKTGYELNIKELAFSYRALEDKKKELEDSNKELRGYQLTHDMLMDQFDRETKIEVSQHLQSLNLEWNGLVDTLIADAIHKMKNELSQFSVQSDPIKIREIWENTPAEIERNMYERLLFPYQQTIMDILNKLPNILDYRSSRYFIKDIVEAAEDAVPSVFRRDARLEFTIKNEVSSEWERGVCLVNQGRLTNIIYNILKNSSTALSFYRTKMRRKGIRHIGEIILCYSIKNTSNKNYLVVSVIDNAGGFPEKIVDKIYHEPVESTDTSQGRRDGGGSSYVKFFADRMNIEVKARNIFDGDVVIGALVEIWIPIENSL